MHKSPQQIICSTSILFYSVQRRIDEMASNVLTLLYEKLRTKTFSLEIGESTLPDNQASPLGYVKSIDNEKICQELLFSTNLETYTKGSSIYNVVEICFNENNIPLTNIVSCATMVHHNIEAS